MLQFGGRDPLVGESIVLFLLYMFKFYKELIRGCLDQFQLWTEIFYLMDHTLPYLPIYSSIVQ